MIKTDLHCHSVASPDGSITAQQIRKALSTGVLDCIAITDHDTIDFAQKLQQELGPDKILVGEEISTKQGDIIGLFLTQLVAPNQDIHEAINDIKSQGGIVYIPHPFETVRKGITRETLSEILDTADIIEAINGRAFVQNLSQEVTEWATKHSIPAFASSDAHRYGGLGKTYSMLDSVPTVKNIKNLALNSKHVYTRPSLLDILAPKRNRIMKRIHNA